MISFHGAADDGRIDAPSADALVEAGERALGDERLPEALRLLHLAESAGAEPDRCAGNRWLANMLAGNFGAAWREGDAIRLRGAPDPHRFWNGEDIRGRRVMLRSLHGFGDAVQMFRFLPRVKAAVAHLIVEVPPRLVELAPYFDGMGEVLTWGAAAPAQSPAWDVQIEVMELPYLLRVNAGKDLEPRTGYLQLPERLRKEAADAMGERDQPRVGLVWTAGHWNPTRSIPYPSMAALACVAGVEFWSLESRHTSSHVSHHVEQAEVPFPPGFRSVYEVGDGILKLAAVVAEMDLVITVDTLAAHLAGALGVPCWLLLQQRADWRWMSQRSDSPWYPSLQLWRQTEPGNWEGLLAQVAEELRAWNSQAAWGNLSC